MGEEKEPGVPVRKQGSLYCLDTNGRCHERIKGSIDISNGLSWTSNHSIMYYCDSLKVYRLQTSNKIEYQIIFKLITF